jgi:hypothetical protein
MDASPTTGTIVSDSGNGSASTIVIQILGGNIPNVGALFTSVGSANAAGAYNLTNQPILSVSAPANPDQGLFTITVAGSGTSASAPDSGQYIIPQPEIGEAIIAGSSGETCAPYNILNSNLNQALTTVVSFPSMGSLTAAIVNLQQAVQNYDSEFQNVAVVCTVAGGVITTGPEITVDPTLGRFFRFNISGLTGTGTIVAKLLL